MSFDVPDTSAFDPLYLAGSAAISYYHTAFGLYVSQLEPFAVKALRRVLPRVHDETLRESVERFCRQEAQHYQRHADFNQVVLAQGYGGLTELLAGLKRGFDDCLNSAGDAFCVGYVEAIESYTTQFAIAMLASGLYDHRRTQPAFGRLFKWHLLEEIEHRTVAFDLDQSLFRPGPLRRAGARWQAQGRMLRFLATCADLMSTADVARLGERCRIGPRQKLHMLTFPLVMRLRSIAPGYSPHHCVLPAGFEALRVEFTHDAQHVA